MKFLKYLSKALLTLILFSLLSYTGFRLVEYFKGNKYVNYLAEHQSTSALDQNLDYKLAANDIANNSLILVGEIHGFKVPTKFDADFYQYLLTEHDVKSYLLEMDHSQAYFMNKFNKTGNTAYLKKALKNWVVIQGRNNLDYLNRWKELQKLYTQNPFQYYGVNNISDVDLMIEHINTLANEELIKANSDLSDSLQLVEVKATLKNILSQADENGYADSLLWSFQYLLRNIQYDLDNKIREEILTLNLQANYDHFQLKEEKVYGYFGIGHTFLNQLEGGYEAMASRIQKLDPWFSDKILSFNFMFCDSYMIRLSSSLPDVLQDEGYYTKLPVSYDNIWLGYLYGIEDMKRVTRTKTKTIFKLDAENSPYKTSNRLFSMFKLLPVGQVLNAAKGLPTTDLGQYVIFVRDSDWAEPLQQ